MQLSFVVGVRACSRPAPTRLTSLASRDDSSRTTVLLATACSCKLLLETHKPRHIGAAGIMASVCEHVNFRMKSIVVVVVSDDLPSTCAEGAAEVATCLCEVVTGHSCRSLMVCEADVSDVTVFL